MMSREHIHEEKFTIFTLLVSIQGLRKLLKIGCANKYKSSTFWSKQGAVMLIKVEGPKLPKSFWTLLV